MNIRTEFFKRISFVGAVLAVSACAEVQQPNTQSDGVTEETTSILPVTALPDGNAAKAERKARFAKLESQDDDISVTSVKLAASTNSLSNASQGGGIVSQNDPPPSNLANKNTGSGNNGAEITSQESVDLNAGKFLNSGGGITSQQKPTFTSP